jgi:hypothetical protein
LLRQLPQGVKRRARSFPRIGSGDKSRGDALNDESRRCRIRLPPITVLHEADPDRFLKKAESYGATGFIENPLGLKLLQNAVAGGETWPANRFQLFASATQRLAFERSAVRNVTERHGANEILNAAAEAFLLLLVSGEAATKLDEPTRIGK